MEPFRNLRWQTKEYVSTFFCPAFVLTPLISQMRDWGKRRDLSQRSFVFDLFLKRHHDLIVPFARACDSDTAFVLECNSLTSVRFGMALCLVWSFRTGLRWRWSIFWTVIPRFLLIWNVGLLWPFILAGLAMTIGHLFWTSIPVELSVLERHSFSTIGFGKTYLEAWAFVLEWNSVLIGHFGRLFRLDCWTHQTSRLGPHLPSHPVASCCHLHHSLVLIILALAGHPLGILLSSCRNPGRTLFHCVFILSCLPVW